jgi:DNA-binding CsgD family transcriptional regulator
MNPAPPLSPVEIASAAALWLAGMDSGSIAYMLQLSEAAVWNAMREIRRTAQAARPLQLRVVS